MDAEVKNRAPKPEQDLKSSLSWQGSLQAHCYWRECSHYKVQSHQDTILQEGTRITQRPCKIMVVQARRELKTSRRRHTEEEY